MATNRKPIQIKPPKATPVDAYSFLAGFTGGMNTMAMPDQIAENETPDVMNMELRSGKWAKRCGYVVSKSVNYAPIQAMHEFAVEGGTPKLMVVAGGKLLIYEQTNEEA